MLFLDIETDGKYPTTAKILSVSTIKLDIVQESSLSIGKTKISHFIKPDPNYKVDNSSEAFKINQISPENTGQSGNPLEKWAQNNLDSLVNSIIVGYNINRFDIPCLRNNLMRKKLTLPKLRTIDLYQAYFQFRKHDLSSALLDTGCDPIPSHKDIVLKQMLRHA